MIEILCLILLFQVVIFMCVALVKLIDGKFDIKKALFFIYDAIDLRDICAFGGLIVIGYGCWQMYQPASFLIVGAGLWWLGVWRIGVDEQTREKSHVPTGRTSP